MKLEQFRIKRIRVVLTVVEPLPVFLPETEVMSTRGRARFSSSSSRNMAPSLI
jgi:hypothetical protein